MLSLTKSRNSGKQLLVLFILLFAFLYSSNIIAQEIGSSRRAYEIPIPEKIHKLVLDPLPSGTYSIGSGGYFPTIDSAFNKLSIDGIAGPVTIELIDELYQADDNGYFLLDGPIQGANADSRVTIRPAENKNVVVEGNGFDVFYFLDVSYLTLDGISITGATTLTVHSIYNPLQTVPSSIDFQDHSVHNIVRNVKLITDDYVTGLAIDFWINSTNSSVDSNLVENCFVKQARIGIIITAMNATKKATGNIIRGNRVGTEADSLIAWGIQVEHCENSIVENNEVQNIRLYGNNNFVIGINSYFGTSDIIRNNIVHNISANNSNSGSVGILLSGSGGQSGSGNSIYNNILYDIVGSGNSGSSRVAGIQMWFQSNTKVYYNSVNLSGIGANPLGSAALYVFSPCDNIDIKNNIFINTRDESPYCASAIYDYVIVNLNSDYNDLFYDDTNPNNCLVLAGGAEYHTLAAWQAMGEDLNSISEMPYFISSSDLHIDKTFPTNLERGATPIAGITTDFDGETRNVSTPDIGADEFDGFTFDDPLPAGTYTIGTGGNFATIQDAFDKLSTDGISGEVSLELIDNLYTAPALQFGYSLNGPIPGAGPNSRVTIKPAVNKNVTIEGNNECVLYLFNTSYVTIDGVGLTGVTNLTIHALQNSNYGFNDALDFMNNSDHNIIENLTFIVDDIFRPSGAGFWFVQTTTDVPDSNLIQNNFVKKAGLGLYIVCSTTGVKGKANLIRGNHIGSIADSLVSFGIQVAGCENTLIENNIVENLKTTLNGTTQFKAGIFVLVDNNDIVRNNNIGNFRAQNGYSTSGIHLSGDGTSKGNNVLVYNNMIYNIQSISAQNDSRVIGIEISNQNNPKIYYNSVYLSGTGSQKLGSAALYIGGGNTGIDAENNILVNTRDEGQYCASAIFGYTSSSLNSDYNDLYYDDTKPNNCLVRIATTNYHTIAEWQATGKDLHSYVEMPQFISSTDLHIDETIATYLESRGKPITGIESDFDGDNRNTNTPDIGADEFDGIVDVEGETTLPTEYALEQNYPNPFNPTTTFRYSIPQASKVVIKVFDIIGNEIATLMDEEKPVGTYELTWNAADLSSGIYFYQLKAGEFTQTRKMILIK